MNPRDCIFFQLAKAGQTGVAFCGGRVEHLGITASQAMVLNFLREDDRIPSHLLGQKLQITSATMTGILDRLEKMALIERRPHPDDRRAILICLTEQGARYAREISGIMVKANKDFLAQLDPDEARTLRDLLTRLREISGIMVKANKDFLAQLDPDEARTLRDLLTRLRADRV